MALGSGDFQGVNAAYALELYERFQRDPKSVDPETRVFFEQFGAPLGASEAVPGFSQRDAGPAEAGPFAQPSRTSAPPASVLVGAVNLAQSIRLYGHLAAQIDPLGSRPCGDPSLLPQTHGVTEADLRGLPASLIGGPVAQGERNHGGRLPR